MIQLRSLQLPDDYPQLAQVLNEYWAEPTTAEKLEEDDSKLYQVGKTSIDEAGRLVGYDRERQVAINDRGDIIGHGWCWRAPWTEPGYLYLTLVVAREYRGQGAGEQLLRHAAEWGDRLGASTLITEVWDDNPDALRFAARRGFTIERHSFQSVLSLEHYDRQIGADVLQQLEQGGIRFLTLSDEPGVESEQKLYEMYTATLRDIPGYLGDVPSMTEWRKWYLYPDGERPELVLIAADGDRYVGVTHLIQNKQTKGMYHEYTGVSEAYRGKQIASALKLLAIRLAKRHDAPYIRTDNDSLNEPILAINRRLGFQPLRGRYRIVAPLDLLLRKMDD